MALGKKTEHKLLDKELKELKELSMTNPSLGKLLTIYETFFSDPTKEWLYTIILIQRAISKAVATNSLDLEEDKSMKYFWEILKTGKKPSETIAGAKHDAGIEDEPKEKESTQSVTPITAETVPHV